MPAAVPELAHEVGGTGRCRRTGSWPGRGRRRRRRMPGEELLDLGDDRRRCRRRTGRCSSPGSSTYRAPGMWSARYRPWPTRAARLPLRWMTSVGAWMAGSTGRRSLSKPRPRHRLGGRRARTAVARALPPLPEPRVGRELRDEQLEVDERSGVVVVVDRVGEALDEVIREPVRIVDVPAETRVRVQQDQRRGPCRMGGGGQHRDERPVVGAAQRGALRAHRVEDRQRVADPLLERRRDRRIDRVRQPDAPQVHADQPAERRQAAVEPRESRFLVDRVDRDRARRQVEEVGTAVAEHLVCDVRIAASRVAGLGVHGHAAGPFIACASAPIDAGTSRRSCRPRMRLRSTRRQKVSGWRFQLTVTRDAPSPSGSICQRQIAYDGLPSSVQDR